MSTLVLPFSILLRRRRREREGLCTRTAVYLYSDVPHFSSHPNRGPFINVRRGERSFSITVQKLVL